MRVITGEAGYTVSSMADEQSTEIFDDLYLGLRAGGALRKQRRGEPLTEEERDALGRRRRPARAGRGGAADRGGARRARALAAPLDMAQGRRDRRLRRGHLRPGIH